VYALAFGALALGCQRGDDHTRTVTAERMARALSQQVRLEMAGGKTCESAIAIAKGQQPEHTTDPWGTPFAFRCKGGLAVVSAGPDETLDTDDDIRFIDHVQTRDR
jgi:hypothetical protein